eukprot:315469_1
MMSETDDLGIGGIFSMEKALNHQINTSVSRTEESYLAISADESNDITTNIQHIPYGYPKHKQNESYPITFITQPDIHNKQLSTIAIKTKKKQLTCRSILIGLFLGCVLCFSNTYFGLQTGWVTMGSLQSALAGYGILQVCSKYNIGGESNKFELNMIQTIAVASATMPLAAGFVGIIPALHILQDSGGPVTLTIFQLFIWTFSLASFGVFVAVPMRKYMIIKQKLKFPSGTATAQMIQLFYAESEHKLHDNKARLSNKNMHSEDMRDNASNQTTPYGKTDLWRKHKSSKANNAEKTQKLYSLMHRAVNNKTSQSVIVRTVSDSRTLHHDAIEFQLVYQQSSLQTQWKVFLYTFIISSMITIIQYFLPVLHNAPIFGTTAAIYLWNIDFSLSYVGQGMIAGTNVGLSMLLGAIIGWAILGPMAVIKDWVQPNGPNIDWQNSEEGWVLWVSLSIMLGESLTSLFIILFKAIIPILCCRNNTIIQHEHTGAEMSAIHTNNPQGLNQTLLDKIDNKTINSVKIPIVEPDEDNIPSKIWMSGLLVSCLFCIISLSLISKLQLKWYEAALALFFALIISILSIRALGQTDMNPVSGVGKVSQIFFSLISPGNVIGNLIAGAMSEASAAQSGDMLQSFKAGHLLSASPRLQFYGALIGTMGSILFSVMAYYLFISVYPDMPNKEFEIPAAELWLNMAQLLNGGSLAQNVEMFCYIAAAIGAMLSLCHDLIFIGKYKYINSYIPSGVALAIGFYITPNYVIPRVIGSILQYIWYRRNKSTYDAYMVVVASGFVLGEGVFAIISAIMTALHVPSSNVGVN